MSQDAQLPNIDSLREERARIREKLYAEYGDRIDAMIADSRRSTLEMSPSDERARRLESMLSERTPLRQQVKAVQGDTIARLVAEAKEAQGRGVDVASRLDMLLSLQRGDTTDHSNSPRQSRPSS